MSELLSFILDAENAFKSKARLASLYSDFARLKTTNPDGYRANVSAWQSALSRASRAGMTPSKSQLCMHAGEQLEKELETKTLGRPVALGAVFDESVAQGDMIPLNDFLASTMSIYKKPGWLPQFQIPTAWEIASWGLRQLGFGRSNRLADRDFVVRANVEVRISTNATDGEGTTADAFKAASNAVLKQLSATLNPATPSSCIYSLETFTSTFSRVLSTSHALSPQDIQILLRHLSRDLNACTMTLPPTTPSAQSDLSLTTTTIKFRPPNSTSPPNPITQQDTTLSHLLTLQESLTTSIRTLESRLTDLNAQLQPLISTSSSNSTTKSRALNLLRQRKTLTTTLSNRQDSLHQIESVINSIDEAAGQVEMVSAMRASADVLKHLHEQIGGTEGVEDVMESLRDEGQKVEEVSGVINEGIGVGGGTVDEGEVEEELAGLVREGELENEKVMEKERSEMESSKEDARRRSQSEQKADLEMPDVPTAEPGQVPAAKEREDETAGSGPNHEDMQMTKDVEKRLSLVSLDEPQRADDRLGTNTEKRRQRQQLERQQQKSAHEALSG